MANKTIQKEALDLSQQERGQLAHVVIDSLNSDTGFESEEEWSKELESALINISKAKAQRNLGQK